MPLLQPEEFNESYFDGTIIYSGEPKNETITDTTHPAGYSGYTKYYRHDGADSLGEFWLDVANKLKNQNALASKKTLEIGCAKGFLVEELRRLGVNSYGVDVSSYAISKASIDVRPHLTVADARTHLDTYVRNEFDLTYSIGFLECLSEADIKAIITNISRISRKQVHFFYENSNPEYYTVKPLSWWAAQGFPKGTILAIWPTWERIVV